MTYSHCAEPRSEYGPATMGYMKLCGYTLHPKLRPIVRQGQDQLSPIVLALVPLRALVHVPLRLNFQ